VVRTSVLGTLRAPCRLPMQTDQQHWERARTDRPVSSFLRSSGLSGAWWRGVTARLGSAGCPESKAPTRHCAAGKRECKVQRGKWSTAVRSPGGGGGGSFATGDCNTLQLVHVPWASLEDAPRARDGRGRVIAVGKAGAAGGDEDAGSHALMAFLEKPRSHPAPLRAGMPRSLSATKWCRQPDAAAA